MASIKARSVRAQEIARNFPPSFFFPLTPSYAANVSQNSRLRPQRFAFEHMMAPLFSNLIVISISKVPATYNFFLCSRSGLWIPVSISQCCIYFMHHGIHISAVPLDLQFPYSQCDPGICAMHSAFSFFFLPLLGARCYDDRRKHGHISTAFHLLLVDSL
jgi:hypothetical protein